MVKKSRTFAFALFAVAGLLAIATQSSSEQPARSGQELVATGNVPDAAPAANQELVGVWTGSAVALGNEQSGVVNGATVAFDTEKMYVIYEGKRESVSYTNDAVNNTVTYRNATFSYWLNEDNLTLFMTERDNKSPVLLEGMIYSLTRQASLAEIQEMPESRPVGVGRSSADPR